MHFGSITGACQVNWITLTLMVRARREITFPISETEENQHEINWLISYFDGPLVSINNSGTILNKQMVHSPAVVAGRTTPSDSQNSVIIFTLNSYCVHKSRSVALCQVTVSFVRLQFLSSHLSMENTIETFVTLHGGSHERAIHSAPISSVFKLTTSLVSAEDKIERYECTGRLKTKHTTRNNR